MKLLREDTASKVRVSKKQHAPLPFLKELKKDTVKGKRSLIFFVWFSAFCFACNTQMAFSMKDLASATMGWMILIIGLILAYMMLLLALSAVVRGNAKTAAMMKIFGYDDNDISRSILNGYRPIACIGFVMGTGYQFGLLKVMVNVVFKNVDKVNSYSFDVKAFCIALPVFIISYELIIHFFSTRIKNHKEINIFEDGKESRDFVYIDDVVDATIAGMEMPEANGHVFNIGTGVSTDVLTVARTLSKHYGIEVPLKVTGNYRLGDIRHNYADVSLAKQILGFQPKWTFDAGIKQFTDWVNCQDLQIDNYEASLKEMKEKGLFK